MRRHGIAGDAIYADAFRGDAARARLLTPTGIDDNDIARVLGTLMRGGVDGGGTKTDALRGAVATSAGTPALPASPIAPSATAIAASPEDGTDAPRL